MILIEYSVWLASRLFPGKKFGIVRMCCTYESASKMQLSHLWSGKVVVTPGYPVELDLVMGRYP